MKFKTIFFSIFAVLAANNSFAQSYTSSPYNLGNCVVQNGVRYCNIVPKGTVVNNNSTTAITPANSQVELPPEIDAKQAMAELNKPQPKGQYNSQVPGGNVFVFCSGGRPGKANPLRVVYDSICPSGKSTSNEQTTLPTTQSSSGIIKNYDTPISTSPTLNNFK